MEKHPDLHFEAMQKVVITLNYPIISWLHTSSFSYVQIYPCENYNMAEGKLLR